MSSHQHAPIARPSSSQSSQSIAAYVRALERENARLTAALAKREASYLHYIDAYKGQVERLYAASVVWGGVPPPS